MIHGQRIKELIVRDLNLEGVLLSEIDDDAPLFGEGGLGLDSLDVVELVLIVKKYFGVEIKNIEEGRYAFSSIRALNDFIVKKQAGE